MLHLAAALIFCCPFQEKAKPADDPEETVAAQKGNLTPVFELEAVYEPVDSAELKLKLEAFQGALTDGGIPASIAATHVRYAADALGELIGVLHTDDVLDVVFRQFCVGK